MSTLSKALTAAAATVVLSGGMASFFTSPASAATARNGKCESGEFCYYFNSNHKGSVSDFKTSVADYGTKQPTCYEYRGPGNGKGKCIKNDAASVWNRSGKTVRVYFNTGYGGRYEDFKAGAKRNLKSSMKNENASHRFSPPSRMSMSYGLYRTGGGRITAGFDGYHNTPGRHEGIDFARGVGANVHNLVSGKITNVARGYKGSGGLSTIAVYSSSANRTVIYLHSAPRSSLRIGQFIKRGQVIADESWRGVSSSGAAHTHVEMRVGRHTHASKSVGDPHLDNPNPTSFWHSQGYSIR